MTIYYVDATGGLDANAGTSIGLAWQTTGKVLSSQASFVAGDQILFKRGETFGVLTMHSGVTGAAGNPIIYGDYGTGVRPIFNAAGGNYACVVDNVSYITLQNLQFTGGLLRGVHALADNGPITHLNFISCRCYSNTLHGFYVQGQAIRNVDDVTYTDCTSELNGSAGFFVYQNTATAAGGITFNRCVSSYNGQAIAGHGFSSYDSNYVTFRKCESRYININPATGMMNFAGEGIGFALDDFARNCTIEHCFAHHNAGPGIQASHQGTDNATLSCVSVYNGGAGIYINGNPGTSTNTIIYNCTVNGNSGYGIDATSGPIVTLLIKNNICTNNFGWGVAFGASSVTGGVVDANLCFGNSVSDMVNVTGATGTVSTDPKFFNAAVSDFSLLAGSGALNAGTDLGFAYRVSLLPGSAWPSSVLTADQRSYGSAWEIGAYISASPLPLAQACL